MRPSAPVPPGRARARRAPRPRRAAATGSLPSGRPRRRPGRTPARDVALGLALLLAAGCASKRELIVTSEPPGALVRVGDEIVGETPLRHPFLHYGAVRVTLYDDEHLTYSKVVDLEPPWYGYPVVDVVSDLFPWRDRHLLHVRLKPLTEESRAGEIDSVLERAEVLRRAGPEGPELLPPRRNVAPAPGPPPAADAALEEEDEPPAPPPPPPGDGGAGRT